LHAQQHSQSDVVAVSNALAQALQDAQYRISDIQTLHFQNRGLSEQLSQSQANCVRLRNEQIETGERMKALEDARLNLESAASAKDKQISDLEDQLRRGRASYNSLQTAHDQRGQHLHNTVNQANALATNVAELKQERDYLKDELQTCRSNNNVEVAKLKLDLKKAIERKAAVEILAEASDQSAHRLNQEVQQLEEKVKQLQMQAAFNKIGDGSVDVPLRLNGILKNLDELPTHLLDQLQADYLQGSMKKWKGDTRALPQVVGDFVRFCKQSGFGRESSLHYAITLLLMGYIQAEVWDVPFHPGDFSGSRLQLV
jgi:chromosome segregation ATPase